MNSDDFEKRLERQTIRSVPSEWRREILQQTENISPSPKTHPLLLPIRTFWRELIWPCRHAWTGMAALWLVLLGINSGLSSGEVRLAKNSATSPAIIERMVEQRQLLTELVPPATIPPAEPPRRNHPQPRSDRRTIWMIG